MTTPSEKVREHLAAMEDWLAGRQSFWNAFAEGGEDRGTARLACAVADAQEVVKRSAAVQACAALIGTGITLDEGEVPF